MKLLFILSSTFLFGTIGFSQHWIETTSPNQHFIHTNKNCNIQIVFNQEINHTSLNDDNIIIVGSKSGKHFSDSIRYSSLNRTVIYYPDKDFITGESVTVTLRDSIVNSLGIYMPKSFNWSFRIAVESGYGQFIKDEKLIPNLPNPEFLKSKDINNDSFADLIFSSGSSIVIYTNDGDGNFSLFRTISTPGLLRYVINDFNNDGYIDFCYIKSSANSPVITLFGDSLALYSGKMESNINSSTLLNLINVDWNGNGYIDLLTRDTDFSSWYTEFLENDGQGHFIKIRSANEAINPFGDIDLDGDIDAWTLISNWTRELPPELVWYKVKFLTNDGKGVFSDFFTINSSTDASITAVNIDNDSDLDFTITTDSLYIFRNDGNNEYLKTSAFMNGTCRYSDWDGDGDLDIAIFNSTKMYIANNNGVGNFTINFILDIPTGVFSSVVQGDWNGDGDVDMAYIDQDSIKFLTNDFVSSIGLEIPKIEKTYILHSNYPNPFNPSTRINYSINKPGRVVLQVFDISGREIKTLVNSYQEIGNFSISFNGTNLSSGIYIYKLLINGITKQRKMLLLR